MKKNEKKNEKQFGFKDIETQVLKTIGQQHNVSLTNFVSYVLVDRLAHQVTQNTKFELGPDFKDVKVWEEEPEAEPTVKLKGEK